MERVQYQLERSVPQLQLLDENGVFTKEQLRSITTQRQTFEGRLLRRGPDKNDFLRYADFERNLADLINVKANRIGLPRSFYRDNAAAHTGHIVAIYERLVLKFKYDVDAWQQYIAFAKSRKMRVVTGRVYARALSLHPNNVPLWLAAAAHELNDNASTTAARSLLQRALRLNRLPWKKSDPDSSASTNGKRSINGDVDDSNKRQRVDNSSSTSITDGSTTPASSGPAALKLSSREADLLRLWVEYIRMELVFIERLRRRWLVLGLQWDTEGADEEAALSSSNDSAEAQQAAVDLDSTTNMAGSANDEAGLQDEETILLGQVPDKDPDANPEALDTASTKPNTFAPRKMTTIPPTQIAILRGNIPLFLIGSALDSLAPHLHFVFLVAVVELLQSFPFAEPISLDAPQSGQALRRRLLDGAYQHLSDRQRWGWTHFAPAALASSLRSFRPETPFYADAPDRTAAQLANTEEMDSHRLLASASHLRTTFSNETDGLLELASQLRSATTSGLQKASASSSSSLATVLVLQLLQSLLTERSGSGARASPAYQKLAQSGTLPLAVNDAITKMRELCLEAPLNAVKSSTRSAKAEFYTTTALLVEMLSDEQRSGIDEPNLLRYLESVQTQLIKEAQAAGSQIETAQMRAITLRKKVEAALAVEDDKERNKKLTKLKEQLKDATGKKIFPGSDELWSLRILVASNLARTSSKSMEESRDAIAAEWHRGLQACSENIDANAAISSAENSLWSRFFDWLDDGVFGSQEPTRKEVKASFRYSSEQYRWAVRETASLLSRSHNKSMAGVEVVQEHRQDVHDWCICRYIRLSRPFGKYDDIVSWLLQSSFGSLQGWLGNITELESEEELDMPKYLQTVERIFAKLLQTNAKDVEVWSNYLRHLASRDMTKALQTLERCRSTLDKSEYKLVEKEWQSICEALQAQSSTIVDNDDDHDEISEDEA
ncbi:U3 small nucleolar RNA-associated protein 6 [Kalmanozyma brasiliensis GHG001]|uniref:U3 small nucleolar RNA-associated protein 6 N-terminal domain-containing protein n=1 Tax=Kalmanozyma brasiliensis (strain GHG001) TaxID=1365824 RepID=V5EZ48_KALBG|nr:U3 small nucleolar RNA-associated protein 6 [Kalmanozyma brasiliensis GHG001]EST08094.1 U3 small nucleolar RNA-associated protein 6 [Kalmanozyma brasiliensis GHG001]